MRNETRKVLSLAAAIASMAVAGCNCCKEADDWHSDARGAGYQDPFFPNEVTHVAERTAMPSVASAARQSATLHDVHFSGDRLNSLGHEKLLLMLGGRDGDKNFAVYLDTTGSDDDFAARSEAVRMFAESLSLNDGELRVEKGPNPGTKTATAPLLRNLAKTDSDGEAAADDGGK